MTTGGRAGKLREWIRRYLPCEMAGTVGEFGGAAVAYLATESHAAAAITATIGASAGYYAAAYLSALRWSYRAQGRRRLPSRVLVANLLAVRSVAVEFGPAELIDSVAVRPVAFYAGPMIVDNTVGGWILAKLVADVAFYLCAIFTYERFKGLLIQAAPHAEEVTYEPREALEAA